MLNALWIILTTMLLLSDYNDVGLVLQEDIITRYWELSFILKKQLNTHRKPLTPVLAVTVISQYLHLWINWKDLCYSCGKLKSCSQLGHGMQFHKGQYNLYHHLSLVVWNSYLGTPFKPKKHPLISGHSFAKQKTKCFHGCKTIKWRQMALQASMIFKLKNILR